MPSHLVNLWIRCRVVLLGGLVVLTSLGSFNQISNSNFAAGFRPSPGLRSRGRLRQGPSALRTNHPSDSLLVVDPVLVYSTFMGGTSAPPLVVTLQQAAAMFVDGSGNTYLAGSTDASDFPVTPGVVQATNSNNDHVGFLAKLDAQGHLIFATYLFGMNTAAGVAVRFLHGGHRGRRAG